MTRHLHSPARRRLQPQSPPRAPCYSRRLCWRSKLRHPCKRWWGCCCCCDGGAPLSPIALYACIAGEQCGPTSRLLQVRQSPRQQEERPFDIDSHRSVVISLCSGMRVCCSGAIQCIKLGGRSNARANAPPSLQTPVATTIPLSFPCFSTAAATAAAHAAAVQASHIALNLGCFWHACAPSVVKSAIKSLANSCKVSLLHTE